MNTNSLLDVASFSPGALNFPKPWVGHLPFAAWVIREISPRIFVELGTHSGNSYFAFCQSVMEAGLATRCYAVDTWQGDEHAFQYGDEVFAQVNAYNSEHFSGFSELMKMTFDEALIFFKDKTIDLLHIDGLHTYEAVRHDFETWLPKLSPGAVVLFHDTNIHERGFGIWRYWEELTVHYKNNLNFLHSCGLGVLQLDTGQSNILQEWLLPDFPQKKILVEYFSSLGSHQLDRYEMKQDITYLNQGIAERDVQIAGLNQVVAERDVQIAGLNQVVAERDVQIAQINQSVAERDEQIAALLNSKSWRLTAPLRSISQRLK